MWSSDIKAMGRAFLAANAAAQKIAAEKAMPQSVPTTPAAQASQVSLSALGLARAALAGSSNTDIKESGLPDSVQKVLTSVRQSQKGLQQMNAQLQAMTNNKSLSPEMRQANMAALQTISAIYQRQISDSSRDLASAMNGLPSADKAKASMLVLARM